MIFGIGTDIVELERISKVVERHGGRFTGYILTDSEADAAEAHARLEATEQQLDEARSRLEETAETLAATTEKMEKAQASLDAIFAKRGASDDGSVFSGVIQQIYEQSSVFFRKSYLSIRGTAYHDKRAV